MYEYLPACIFTICMSGAQDQKRGRSSRAGVTDRYEPPCWYWGSNLCSCKSNKYLNHWAISLASALLFLHAYSWLLCPTKCSCMPAFLLGVLLLPLQLLSYLLWTPIALREWLTYLAFCCWLAPSRSAQRIIQETPTEDKAESLPLNEDRTYL